MATSTWLPFCDHGEKRSALDDLVAKCSSSARQSIVERAVFKVRFPGHALHEKGLQRQKSVGPLVSSQEERALLVPVINR